MTDSTRVLLPAAEAFRSGVLRIQEEAGRGFTGDELSWGDYPVNAVLVTVFVILALMSQRSLMNIFPRLLNSLTRWKVCVAIDASMQTRNDRNILGVVYTLPIALLCDRYDLLHTEIINVIPESWHGLVTTGILALWFLVRKTLMVIFGSRARKPETLRTAHLSFFNYWILAGFLMVITIAVSSAAGLGDGLISKLLLWEGAVLYAVAFVRKAQILRSFCGPFATFLYLCGLEILPTGALVAGTFIL